MDQINYETDSDEFNQDMPTEINEHKDPLMITGEQFDFLDDKKMEEDARLAEEASIKSNPREVAKAAALATMTWANEPIQNSDAQVKKQEVLTVALTGIGADASLPECIERALFTFRMAISQDRYTTAIQESCLSMFETPWDGKPPKRNSSDFLRLVLAALLCGIFSHASWSVYPLGFFASINSGVFTDALMNPRFLELMSPFFTNHTKKPTDTQLFLIFIAFLYRWMKPGDPTIYIHFATKNLFHPNSSSLVKFLSAIKKATGLKDGFGDFNLGQEWVHVLRWPEEMVDARRTQATAAIRNKMTNVIIVQQDLIGKALNRWALNAETSGHLLAGWLAVQLAVGCRCAEVISPNVTFSLVEKGQVPDGDESLWIIQTGQVKTKVLPEDALPRLKPVLRIGLGWQAPDIIRQVNAIRAAVEKETNRKLAENTPQFFNNKYNARLNRLLSTAFTTQKSFCQQHGIVFGTHFLRALYAMYMWDVMKNNQKTPSQTQFISDILGHDDPRCSPSKHYECIRIVQSSDMSKWAIDEDLWGEDDEPKSKKKSSVSKKRSESPVVPKAPKKERKPTVLPKLDDIKLNMSETEEDVSAAEESEPEPKKKSKKRRLAAESDADSDATAKPKPKKPSEQPPKVGAVRELSKGHIALCVRKVNNPENLSPWFTHHKFDGKGDKEKLYFALDLMLKLGKTGIFPTAKILAKFACNYKTFQAKHKGRLLRHYNIACTKDPDLKDAVVSEDVDAF